MGILYIVATPIGNIEDISLRAARLLLTADVIACEDTRKTGILLSEIKKLFSDYTEIKKPRLLSYYDQTELARIPEVIEILSSGQNVVLASDAGTPTISDPGFKLVRACIEKGIPVTSLPGPSAVIVALSLSGLPTDRFLFMGYPPKKDSHRKDFFIDIKQFATDVKATIILYEAPHRILKTLEEMILVLGKEQYVVLARELTKIYEEVFRGSLGDAEIFFTKKEPKGEFVILFHG